MTDITPTQIVDFWFSDAVRPLHFRKSPEFDKEIAEKFLSAYEEASRGELEQWQETAMGYLALILLLDQFPRNMFRDDKRAFATDDEACRLSLDMRTNGFEAGYSSEQMVFLHMPLMHSEDLVIQNFSVALFEELGIESNLKFAIAHRDIIARFGRFPHRNEILVRSSTAEEIEFLKQPNSGF
ncbi:MAG: DUF924 domain-containing protein [bacterium]|nr:DUF924 domain-containing protein [bacterium]